jgi:hypothetical protein
MRPAESTDFLDAILTPWFIELAEPGRSVAGKASGLEIDQMAHACDEALTALQ